jgi:hypothetical protein
VNEDAGRVGLEGVEYERKQKLDQPNAIAGLAHLYCKSRHAAGKARERRLENQAYVSAGRNRDERQGEIAADDQDPLSQNANQPEHSVDRGNIASRANARCPCPRRYPSRFALHLAR